MTDFEEKILEQSRFLEDEINELKRENKALKQANIEYKDRIDKAIEYMKYNATSNYFDEEKNMFRREIDLLEILKGEDNE